MTVIWDSMVSCFKVLFEDFQLPIGISLGAFIWAITILYILIGWILPFLKKDSSDSSKGGK